MGSPIEAEIIDLDETLTAVVRVDCPPDAIGPEMEEAHHEIGVALAEYQRRPVGPPFARYLEVGATRVVFEVGIPVDGPFLPSGRVEPSTLPGGRAAAAIHGGAYVELGPSYRALEAWIEEHGLAKGGVPWEVYLTDPEVTPDVSDYRTRIVWPLG